jgi:hypothetical protein
VNLRKQARGRECQIRVPNHCLRTTETVVGCHLRMAGLTGFGLKADDLFISWGCYACHQIVDGQRNSEFSHDERRLMLLEGVIRTQAILLNEGKINIVTASRAEIVQSPAVMARVAKGERDE